MALYYRQPHKLCVVWTRHGRRLCSEVHSWESMVDDPYRGVVSWSVPENITATVTLFHTGKFAKCEDKSWMFVIENVSTVNFCYPMSACNAYRARYWFTISVHPYVRLSLRPMLVTVSVLTYSDLLGMKPKQIFSPYWFVWFVLLTRAWGKIIQSCRCPYSMSFFHTDENNYNASCYWNDCWLDSRVYAFPGTTVLTQISLRLCPVVLSPAQRQYFSSQIRIKLLGYHPFCVCVDVTSHSFTYLLPGSLIPKRYSVPTTICTQRISSISVYSWCENTAQWRAQTGRNETQTMDGRKSTGGKNDKGITLPWRISKLIHVKPHFKLTRMVLGRVYFPEAWAMTTPWS